MIRPRLHRPKHFVALEVDPAVQNDGSGALEADLWFAQLNRSITQLQAETNTEVETYGYVVSSAMGLTGLRNQILATSTQDLPEITWVVIYGSIFALALLLAFSFADRRCFFLVTNVLAYVTLAILLLGLSILQSPLDNEGFGGVVATEEMRNFVSKMAFICPDQPKIDCPRLEPGVYHEWNS